MECVSYRRLIACRPWRSTQIPVLARHSNYKQEWRSNGSGGRGGGRGDGSHGTARGRGRRPTTSTRGPGRAPYEDDGRARLYDKPTPSGRQVLEPRSPPSRAPPPPASAPQDPFANLRDWIQTQHQDGTVIRRETWEKLLGHVRSGGQAGEALQLMLRDAAGREAAGWDWATHGYGQTAFQLVQVAAEVGAPEVAEQLLERREELHLTLNKDLVPTLIRKVAAATSGAAEGPGGPDEDLVDACVDVVQRLYDKEVTLRGANSPEAAYELSRLLRRAGDVRGVRALHQQMLTEGLAVRDRLLEDVERWLAKRGVRV